jgi:tetratricopeptide (TPR) repeat protein
LLWLALGEAHRGAKNDEAEFTAYARGRRRAGGDERLAKAAMATAGAAANTATDPRAQEVWRRRIAEAADWLVDPSSSDPASLFRSGSAWLVAGDPGKARERFLRAEAATREPGASLLLGLARSELALGAYGESRRHLEAALSSTSDPAVAREIHGVLGRWLHQQGELETAIAEYRLAGENAVATALENALQEQERIDTRRKECLRLVADLDALIAEVGNSHDVSGTDDASQLRLLEAQRANTRARCSDVLE